jgi:hypothetical protein
LIMQTSCGHELTGFGQTVRTHWLARSCALLLALACVVLLTGCSAPGNADSGAGPASSGAQTTDGGSAGSPTGTESGGATGAGADAAQNIAEGGSLIIATSEVSPTAQFYPVTVDGTRMEVIAVEAPDGSLRTAFNTCQVCYDSGRGYYVQEGDELVCQNCGNRFPMDLVEIEAGGCNPWPIFKDSKTTTDESITIAYDFLRQAKTIFANWKAGQ